jgi:hypothetical protein
MDFEAFLEQKAKADWKLRVESGLCEYCDQPAEYTGLGVASRLRKVTCATHRAAIASDTLTRL